MITNFHFSFRIIIWLWGFNYFYTLLGLVGINVQANKVLAVKLMRSEPFCGIYKRLAMQIISIWTQKERDGRVS